MARFPPSSHRGQSFHILRKYARQIERDKEKKDFLKTHCDLTFVLDCHISVIFPFTFLPLVNPTCFVSGFEAFFFSFESLFLYFWRKFFGKDSLYDESDRFSAQMHIAVQMFLSKEIPNSINCSYFLSFMEQMYSPRPHLAILHLSQYGLQDTTCFSMFQN